MKRSGDVDGGGAGQGKLARNEMGINQGQRPCRYAVYVRSGPEPWKPVAEFARYDQATKWLEANCKGKDADIYRVGLPQHHHN